MQDARSAEVDLPKKQLRNMTGRNMTWGVFKAYAFFLNVFGVKSNRQVS